MHSRKRKKVLYGMFGFLALALFVVMGFLYAPRHVATPRAEVLSNAEYEALSHALIDELRDSDPRAAIAHLKEETIRDPRVARACHELLHEMGRAALVWYAGDFAVAMSYQDEFCISGYIHGVIEAYFKETKDVEKVMQRACVEYAPNTFMEWECHHGIGHGLMFYSQNDVPASLANCRTYKEERNASACANGVFMENFNADTRLHKTVFARIDDPFFPCNTDVPFKSDCYMSAPIFYLTNHGDDYGATLRWCGSAGEERDACAYGVGVQIVRRNIGNLPAVKSLCRSAPLSLRSSCVSGMANGIVSHYHSRKEAIAFCNEIDAFDRLTCRGAATKALL